MTSNKNDNRADDLKRALLAIRQLREKVSQLESQASEPIAIVGQACRRRGFARKIVGIVAAGRGRNL